MFTGTPMYFPNDVSIFIENMDCKTLLCCFCALGKRTRNDLDVFMNSTEARQNSCIIWYIDWHCCYIVVAKTSSSAHKRWLTSGAILDILTPWHCFSSRACPEISDRTSIHRMKIHGDRGSPCQMPDACLNHAEGFPLTRTK